MATVGRRYHAPVCWANLDFMLRREVSRGEKFFHAEIAIRGLLHDLHGSRVDIQLLNAARRPLTKISPATLDFFDLPWTFRNGRRSTFKSAEFSAADLPVTLAIRVDENHYV